jgi:hypothetical protein
MSHHPIQQFVAGMAAWHITFGTYGTRLHGSFAPRVNKHHNERGTEFLPQNAIRVASDRDRMKFAPRYFTHEERTVAPGSRHSVVG